MFTKILSFSLKLISRRTIVFIKLILCLNCLNVEIANANTNPNEKVRMNFDILKDIIAKNNVTDLDDLPGYLPASFLANFTLKHGLIEAQVPYTNRSIFMNGPRGHLLEADIPGLGQHSDPLAPRVFIFDQHTGFGISYNGGYLKDGSLQQGWNTLDTISFDFVKKEFELIKFDFDPTKKVIHINSNDCKSCHGPKNRPIFSMYPDWPRFYGSDNDELLFAEKAIPQNAAIDPLTQKRRDIQAIEWAWFQKLRQAIDAGDAQTKYPNNKRLKPLFNPAVVKAQHGYEMYSQYPYRSNVEEFGKPLNPSDTSRAFATRAGLRFNLLYSRLLVQQLTQMIKSHPNFNEAGYFFVYNKMRCAPERNTNQPNLQRRVIQRWNDRIVRLLRQVEKSKSIAYETWSPEKGVIHHSYFTLGENGLNLKAKGSLLEYGQNLALMGLKINDVDMRFSYYHEAYLPQNAFKDLCPAGMNMKDFHRQCYKKVMDVGYLGDSFFNSYNDGSTTTDEHLTAQLLTVLSQSNVELRNFLRQRGSLAIRGLTDKYGGDTFKARMLFDREFFNRMDSPDYSKWFSLPYPYNPGDEKLQTSFMELHHRALFNPNYRASYEGVCNILEKYLLNN